MESHADLYRELLDLKRQVDTLVRKFTPADEQRRPVAVTAPDEMDDAPVDPDVLARLEDMGLEVDRD